MSHDRRVLREQLAPQISEKLFDGSPDAVYVLSLDGSFIDANDVLLERLATSREDLLTEMRFQPTVVSDELDEVQSKFNDAAAGKTVRYRATAINVHGGTFRAEIVNTPLYLEGEVVAVLGIARDIGPAEEDARAHIELEQRFERVLNTISDGIIFVNTDCRSPMSTRRRNLFGCSPPRSWSVVMFGKSHPRACLVTFGMPSECPFLSSARSQSPSTTLT